MRRGFGYRSGNGDGDGGKSCIASVTFRALRCLPGTVPWRVICSFYLVRGALVGRKFLSITPTGRNREVDALDVSACLGRLWLGGLVYGGGCCNESNDDNEAELLNRKVSVGSAMSDYLLVLVTGGIIVSSPSPSSNL
jgi:hypothetical protein